VAEPKSDELCVPIIVMQTERQSFPEILRSESSTALYCSAVALYVSNILVGLMFLWAVYGDNYIQRIGIVPVALVVSLCLSLSLAVSTLAVRVLLPKFVNHVRMVLIDQKLLLQVLSDSQHVRFPSWDRLIQNRGGLSIPTGVHSNSNKSKSFSIQMHEFIAVYPYCCRAIGAAAWPKMGALIFGLTLFSSCSLLSIVAIFYLTFYELSATPLLLSKGLQLIGLGTLTGVLFASSWCLVLVTAVVLLLQATSIRRALSEALDYEGHLDC